MQIAASSSKPKFQLTQERIKRFWKKVIFRSDSECWDWAAGKDKDGYAVFNVAFKTRGVGHRFSYALHKGEIPDGMLIMHSCDNPPCCNPDHLSKGDVKANTEDKIKKNRQCKGENHYCFKNPELVQGENNGESKLKKSEVLLIRKEFSNGASRVSISKKHNKVSYSIICRIIKRKSWKHA